jgi:hypothetical protein
MIYGMKHTLMLREKSSKMTLRFRKIIDLPTTLREIRKDT